jgi:hypothetical protein
MKFLAALFALSTPPAAVLTAALVPDYPPPTADACVARPRHDAAAVEAARTGDAISDRGEAERRDCDHAAPHTVVAARRDGR